MDEKPEWVDLLQKVHEAKDANTILALCDDVETSEDDTKWRVLSAGLDHLIEMEFAAIGDVILEHALCHSGFTAHIIQDRLARWLQQDAPERRTAVISGLISEMTGPVLQRRQNALWTALSIGYRTEKLENCLLLGIENAVSTLERQLALWGLVWLGYPDLNFIETSILDMLRSQPFFISS